MVSSRDCFLLCCVGMWVVEPRLFYPLHEYGFQKEGVDSHEALSGKVYPSFKET